MTVWRKGMLAVCVDGKAVCGLAHRQMPIEGEVYRVDGVVAPSHWVTHFGAGLLINGMLSDNPSGDYAARRFRPAVTDNKACDDDFRALIKRRKKLSA